jgi:hypothetical protein
VSGLKVALASPSTVVNPIVAALSALTVNIGNVAVVFSLISNKEVGVVEAAVVGVISTAAVIANSIHKS